ncbi:MAG: DNA starvation/stationary phase protection protein [Alphaproteobacteria bacterium]|nr:MAG: DNA starvation/stationary phase protection protein [Alphaproteobacteria bacterium]
MTKATVESLKVGFSNTYALYLKTQNYHWNVKGPDFAQLHVFLEGQYQELAETVDDLAERIVTLGGKAPGSFREFQSLMTTNEAPEGSLSALEMIEDLLLSYATTISSLRDVLPHCSENTDAGTEDLISSVIGALEKKAWMLRAHLKQ